MNSTDLVLRIIDAFDLGGVSYMLVGSYSSNYYGRPRSTKDADFVAQIDSKQDLSYVFHWADQHGTRELFDRLLNEAKAVL